MQKRDWIQTKEYGIEGRYRCGPPYHMILHVCRRYSIWIRNICLMYKNRVYNNLFWIFLIQMEYRLQSMYNHMVGRAASFVSPFYFILLDSNWRNWVHLAPGKSRAIFDFDWDYWNQFLIRHSQMYTKVLGTFPKAFSQGRLPKYQFPKGELPKCAIFPKRKLLKC